MNELEEIVRVGISVKNRPDREIRRARPLRSGSFSGNSLLIGAGNYPKLAGNFRRRAANCSSVSLAVWAVRIELCSGAEFPDKQGICREFSRKAIRVDRFARGILR